MIFDLEGARRREVQAIGAAISTRSWHGVETAYNALRDKIDAVLHQPAAALALSQTLPAPGEVEYIDRGKLRRATDDLIVAVRSSWGIGSAEHNLVRDICDLIARAPGVALATVAAGDDEGADEALDRRVRIAAWNAAKKSGASDALGYAVVEAVVAEFAAIRLLSQGGGKA